MPVFVTVSERSVGETVRAIFFITAGRDRSVGVSQSADSESGSAAEGGGVWGQCCNMGH